MKKITVLLLLASLILTTFSCDETAPDTIDRRRDQV